MRNSLSLDRYLCLPVPYLDDIALRLRSEGGACMPNSHGYWLRVLFRLPTCLGAWVSSTCIVAYIRRRWRANRCWANFQVDGTA